MSPRVAAVVLALAGAIHAGRAGAQAPAIEATVDSASDHFSRGATFAQQRDYESASREFEASYKFDPSKDALFAWAQAERLRGNCRRAIELYRQFLQGGGLTDAQSEAAKLNVSRCERVVEEEDALAAKYAVANPSAVAAPVPPSRRLSVLGWTLLGASAATFGSAGVFYYLARSDEQSATDSGSYEDYEPRIVRARNKMRIAAGLAGAGVLLGGGALLQYLWPLPGQANAWADPHGGGGLLIAGRF